MSDFKPNAATDYLDRYLADKGIGLDDSMTGLESRGIIATYQLAWEIVAQFSTQTQAAFIAKCTQIDFVNHDVLHFIDHVVGETMKAQNPDFVS